MEKTKKLTKSAEKVLGILKDLTNASAEEIYEHINKNADKKVGLTSIYRALKLLEENFLLVPVVFNDGISRYRLNTEEKHHHHFVCKVCNTKKVIDFCPYELVRKELGDGYIVNYHIFELFGICKDCNENK